MDFARHLVRKLQAAGFPEGQSEAVSTVIRDAHDADLGSLATKADLEGLRAATRADLRETELRLDAKMETFKSDIIKWVFGAIGFQTVVIVGAATTLARLFVK